MASAPGSSYWSQHRHLHFLYLECTGFLQSDSPSHAGWSAGVCVQRCMRPGALHGRTVFLFFKRIWSSEQQAQRLMETGIWCRRGARWLHL